MPVKFARYNMTEIKDRVNAAELLQSSGEHDQADQVLIKLAKEILEVKGK